MTINSFAERKPFFLIVFSDFMINDNIVLYSIFIIILPCSLKYLLGEGQGSGSQIWLKLGDRVLDIEI